MGLLLHLLSMAVFTLTLLGCTVDKYQFGDIDGEDTADKTQKDTNATIGTHPNGTVSTDTDTTIGTDTDPGHASYSDEGRDSEQSIDGGIDAGAERASDTEENTDTDTETTTDSSVPMSCIEGALRCSGTGSPARDICKEGQFVAATPCAENEICDSREVNNPGTCAPLAEICRGNANGAVCEEAKLHLCSPDSMDLSVTACESKRHCQLGIAKGQCAICLPGTFKCDGRQLKKCDDTGHSWKDEKLCDRADLCNADTGSCTDLTCLPRVKKCDGDNLMVCNDNQTGFVLETHCGKDLCNPSELRCDVCLPNERSCNDNRDGYRVCNADGLAYTNTACGTSQPYCVGAVACVQCIEDNHCSTANVCKQAFCNATNVCGSQNRLEGTGTCNPTTASSGVCDGKGGCVECITAEHCSTDYCVFNMCHTCEGECGVDQKCNRNIDCASGKCEVGLCRPSCSGSCAIGEVCAKSDDCASGECDSETKRCTKTCGNVTITTYTSYENARECVVIDGYLELNHAAALKKLYFPNLKTITGDLYATLDTASAPPIVTALDMPMLQTVGGKIELRKTLLKQIDWPKLTTIGKEFNIGFMSTEEILLPSLETIGGEFVLDYDTTTKIIDLSSLKESLSVTLNSLTGLTDLKLEKIEKVGNVNLGYLFYLSYDKVKHIVEDDVATGDVVVRVIGCCLGGQAQKACENFNAESTCH